MDTQALKKFAVMARKLLLEQMAARLESILDVDSLERREMPEVVAALEKSLQVEGRDAFLERMAYGWFNRLCALRFMDLRGYGRIRVISPRDGESLPEILAEARRGNLDKELVPDAGIRQKVRNLLDGISVNPDPMGQAQRLLLCSACAAWARSLPFLFASQDGLEELLLPFDLLSPQSVPALFLNELQAENCRDVEVLGWLYQFYISDKKEAIFASKNLKIAPADIPAATQLFTPAWIARYLAENSLGRLWLSGHPESDLARKMAYYIAPEKACEDQICPAAPQEIRICDPACGSGHMLLRAFDLLWQIYLEEGYGDDEIAALILENNLFGLEIDQRAASLAAFALVMKAREKDPRFFARDIRPRITLLEKLVFSGEEKARLQRLAGEKVYVEILLPLLDQFSEADNFGALIRPDIILTDAQLAKIMALDPSDLLGREVRAKALRLCAMAQALSRAYHVIIANPPYMGSRGMNARLVEWARENYPESKADLFAMFMERALELALDRGYLAMVTMQSWMFLSSFEELRKKVLGMSAIVNMAHLGSRAFDSISGEVVSTTAFITKKGNLYNSPGTYLRLVDGKNEQDKTNGLIKIINDHASGDFYRAQAQDFTKIPGSPIAYWISDNIKDAFSTGQRLKCNAKPLAGLSTGNNDRFMRYWFEVDINNISFNCSSNDESIIRNEKWYPCNSGGDFRKWYGNNEIVVNWQFNGKEIKNFRDSSGKLRSAIRNKDFYFKPGITWTKLSATYFAARLREKAFLFEDSGRVAFPEDDKHIYPLLGFFCSKVCTEFLKILNPSLSFTSGDIGNLPIKKEILSFSKDRLEKIIKIYKADWDASEISWNFQTLPLLEPRFRKASLEESYRALRAHWRQMTQEARLLEEENNRLIIEAYGLSGELDPEVPLAEITLNCNPSFRYGEGKSEAEYEALLLADAMRDLVSYAVGCMFGRYSPDAPGLLLAEQGQDLADFRTKAQDAAFMPDEDNVIPILDGEWFKDDMAARMRAFLRHVFGPERMRENLAFLETALGKDLGNYFLKDFYADHLKRYRKRPIYWLFQSPRGGFSALCYLHRLRPGTVGLVRSNYLVPYIRKLEEEAKSLRELPQDARPAEKARAMKKLLQLEARLGELKKYERDVLHPLASARLEIDLDAGVRANYVRFGSALRKIPGLED